MWLIFKLKHIIVIMISHLYVLIGLTTSAECFLIMHAVSCCTRLEKTLLLFLSGSRRLTQSHVNTSHVTTSTSAGHQKVSPDSRLSAASNHSSVTVSVMATSLVAWYAGILYYRSL